MGVIKLLAKVLNTFFKSELLL